MKWEKILEHAQSGDAGREHRAIVQAWTVLRDEGFPPVSEWSAVKKEALWLVDGLTQKYGDDRESFTHDLSQLEDAILRRVNK